MITEKLCFLPFTQAKGLEANNVYLLATDRMPHPLGGLENNICYVAITRAKKNLFF